MKILISVIVLGVILGLGYATFAFFIPQLKPNHKPFTQPQMQSSKERIDQGQYEKATFAGGCFWCIEPAYQEYPGVIEAVVGYAGGLEAEADYQKVSSGKTTHREAAQVTYDPVQVSYETLLEIFWRQIDPTDAGGQFADRGPHYTTAIYYHTPEQKALAEESKKALMRSDKFNGPIATEIEPYSTFFLAEEHHQDYYQKSSQRYKKYKKGSGREDYLDQQWGEDQLEDLETKERKNEGNKSFPSSQVLKFSSFVKPNDQIIRKSLTPLQYKVTQHEGTERPFDNPYWDHKEEGIYVDILSGEPLYSSTHKYKSGTGWPTFWQVIDDQYIVEKKDWKLIYPRTEIRSQYGDNHIGHVFSDGPKPTGLRYCMNSAALRFVPLEQMKAKGYEDYLYLFE